MSNYDNRQLRYSCFSELSLVSHSHPLSLSLKIKKMHWKDCRIISDTQYTIPFRNPVCARV